MKSVAMQHRKHASTIQITKVARTSTAVPSTQFRTPSRAVVCSVNGPGPQHHARDLSAHAAATEARPSPSTPPAAAPKAKTLGWTPLRSEMVTAAVPAPPSTVAQTPFDVAFGQFMGTVLQTFFWPVAPPDAHALLVKSLRHTLSAYPTFCGRAMDGGKININNAGVLVHLGECAATLADVMPSIIPETQMYEVANVSEFNDEAAGFLLQVIASQRPLLVCTIGTLADGGLVVMINFQHMLCDTHSLRQFLYDWAAATRAMLAGQAPPTLPVYESGRGWFDKLASLAASAPAPSSPVDASVSPSGSPWVHVPFHVRPPGGPPPCTSVMLYISQSRLKQLKATAMHQAQRASGDGGIGGAGYISTNDALMARLRQVLARLPCRGPSRPSLAAMAVEMRKRLQPLVGQADTPVCSVTALGNILQAAQLQVAHDPTVADLGAMSTAVRDVIVNSPSRTLADVAWAAQVEREHGINIFLEYVFGKLDLFGPTPDFVMSNWEYDGSKLDFGTGPTFWIQGWLSIPELALITPACHPDFAGGSWVNLCLTNETMAVFKQEPNSI